MVVKLIEDLSPSHIAFVYDTKHPSFRKKLYSEYKANRLQMPDDLVPQIPYIKKFVDYLGLCSFEQRGYEADDLIATMVEYSKKKSIPTCIVSSDKDLMQLLTHEHIYMFDAMKNKKIQAKDVKEKMGVSPEHITDYLALAGDSSDNIPGVKGIGPKSATSLLDKWKTVENLYKNITKLKKNKQRENLESYKDMAFLSKELSIVKKDIELDFSWKSLICAPKFSKKMELLCEELEFNRLVERMRQWHSTDASLFIDKEKLLEDNSDEVKKLSAKYKLILSLKELEEVFQSLDKEKVIAFDTETTGLEHNADLVGFSFCASKKEAFYVPLAHKKINKQCDFKKAIKALGEFLSKKKIVGQNIKFDLNVLYRYGLYIENDKIAFDTMLASYVLEPEARHSLGNISDRYLNHKCASYKDLMKEDKKCTSFAELDLKKAKEYACEDAHVTWLLYIKLKKCLEKEEKLKKVYYEIEIPLLSILAAMEREGVEIDTEFLQEMSFQLESEIARLTDEAEKIAGKEFNLASPKQLQHILFEKLKIPSTNLKKGKTGYSTDLRSLKKIAIHNELPSVILRFREVSKLKNTYVDVMPLLVDKNSRVHTNFNQSVTATGRLSSSHPNLQNIPIRSDLGQKIRGAFTAKKGTCFVGADYNQIELRVLAFLSRDQALLECFKEEQDIHSATAIKIFSIKSKKVTSEQRRQAKAINFGLIYGKTAFSLAEELSISREEASLIIKNYFKQYPSVKNFLDTLPEKARKTGFAETLYGRKRYIDGINAKNTFIRNMAERVAINTPIQGTAADIIKLAMNDLYEKLKALKTKIILQVHDELILEVPKKEEKRVVKILKESMESVGKKKGFPQIDVPLSVDLSIGEDWLSLK